jgi:hypothetical protein
MCKPHGLDLYSTLTFLSILSGSSHVPVQDQFSTVSLGRNTRVMGSLIIDLFLFRPTRKKESVIIIKTIIFNLRKVNLTNTRSQK